MISNNGETKADNKHQKLGEHSFDKSIDIIKVAIKIIPAL